MEYPERKATRLKDFDYRQNGAYFVTICTQNREKVLSDIVGDDAHIVPKTYGMVLEKYIRSAPEVKKYVIMPDHVHLLIVLDTGTMWASSPTNRNKLLNMKKTDPMGRFFHVIKLYSTNAISAP